MHFFPPPRLSTCEQLEIWKCLLETKSLRSIRQAGVEEGSEDLFKEFMRAYDQYKSTKDPLYFHEAIRIKLQLEKIENGSRQTRKVPIGH